MRLRGQLVSLALLIAIAAGCGAAGEPSKPLQEAFEAPGATGALVDALPLGWSLHEQRSDELPWGDLNEGSGGSALVLMGPATVDFLWKVSADAPWMSAPYANEALEVWLLPGDYRPSPPALGSYAHVPAAQVYAGEGLTAFARVVHVITSKEEFDSTLARAVSTSWSDIGRNSVSWTSWQSDLSAALESYERSVRGGA